MSGQWFTSVQAAFPDEHLSKRILAEAQHEPTRLPQLFEDISRYVLSLKQQQQQSSQQLPANVKKRKLEDGSAGANGAPHAGIANPVIAFECKDVSVQIPARKKLKVQFLSDAKDARRRELRLLNSTNNGVEYALPADQIDDAFCLPVPDKQARQTFFAVIPTPDAVSADGTPAEQVLFTLNETSPPASASATEVQITEEDTHVSVTQRALEKVLATYGKRLTMPSAAEFASSRPQLHRKGEKAYHVNAHRGSKEGYLFFLPTGILFGPKKPLAFFPFRAIDSISYTSVLQRTFNLVISTPIDPNASTTTEIKEIEFSMLDQEDFANIDAYVKRHGLHDASMAAARRAKEYNVNKEVKGEGEDGKGELDKAVEGDEEQRLQDEEDEEEEDYEASGGESDGEGEDSEEDDEEEGEGYDDGDDDEEDGERHA